MQHRMTRWMALGAAVAMACTSQPSIVTTNRTSSTASGDVALGNEGMWADTLGGVWMDGSGGMRMGGRNGMAMGLQTADIRAMSNENIVAHLAAGDSLEIALSQAGADRAQNPAVREFARRMVTEHTAHMQMGKQMAAQGGITPMPSPADTADAVMAGRMITRLSNASPSANADRQLMRAEVVMHQHMLHELTLVRPQATGAAQQLVDHTIPVVRQHLADAQALWREVGGTGNDLNGTRGTHSSGTNP